MQVGIAKRFEFHVPIQTRSVDEPHSIVSGNPLLEDGIDHGMLAVMFLAALPSAKQIARLDTDPPGDRFVVPGREVYVYCPSGFARTKLTNAWFDSKLATVSTGRHWRTTLKLLEMAGG